jgi:hypothetical protein
VKYLSHVGSVCAMCRCLKVKNSGKVTLYTVCTDSLGKSPGSCCELFGLWLCLFTGIPCAVCLVVGLEYIIQKNLEDACCPHNPCCSKWLSEHCYEEPDRATQAKSAAFTARVTASDVAPLLVNQL